MKSIVLILPYFTMGRGKFPQYFQFFLNSCAANSTIDWLIYTDDAFAFDVPKNIYIHKCTFDSFKERFKNHFDFNINLDRPYKLCDYKVAYGEVLQSDIYNYDFWGHCDCDLVFGDIRSFVTDQLLEQYDKLFTRGHFSLYRNTKEVNSFYKSTDYYKTVFTNPNSFAFDEWGKHGISSMYQEYEKSYYDELPYDDLMPEFDGFHMTKAYKGAYSEKNDVSQVKYYYMMKYIYYEYLNGKLYRKCLKQGDVFSEEVLYAHFQKRPLSIYSTVDFSAQNFVVVPNKIIPYVKWSQKDIKKHLVKSETFHNSLMEMYMYAYSFYKTYIKPFIKVV